jgi:carboxypeptidase Q
LAPGAGVSDHGSLLVTGNADNRRPDAMPTVPQVVVATEHYGRIVRTLERGVPVRVELDVQNRFHDESLDSFNILAEIPGTDRADEVVMLGAHFDSWHAGTGATDNAAGVAATMEAMRILKATGLTMRRTVRLALWTGEEQGLLGSQAYVAEHFATPTTMDVKLAHARLSAYFNLDHGTGAIRGLYLEQNEKVRSIFSAWMEPFAEMGMRTLTIRGTGSTDHVPFDRVGLPGFQFIQDPIEYFTHSHHSSMDLYERAQAEDLMKNAVIVAAFVYQAATRDALLPRKALPAPFDAVSEPAGR